MKKKVLSVVLAVGMTLSLAACASGQTQASSEASQAEADAAQTVEETTMTGTDTEPSVTGERDLAAGAENMEESASVESKVASSEAASVAVETEMETEQASADSLVVYFSWSGNTKNVAEAIQQQTGADIFEIVPVVPYSDDYDTVVSDAQEEQKENARPEIADTIDNLENYDTIYVGYPCWWGDMPMILYTFFDTYDLSGKTVSLFCTSGGSGLADTVNEVKALEPDAIVTEELHIRSGAASDPDEAVAQWLAKISE